jgi:hypothetical protein
LSNVELFDAPVLDDPDEGAIKRFLNWLENDLDTAKEDDHHVAWDRLMPDNFIEMQLFRFSSVGSFNINAPLLNQRAGLAVIVAAANVTVLRARFLGGSFQRDLAVERPAENRLQTAVGAGLQQ